MEYEVPKEELPKNVKFKKIYGDRIEKKKFEDAPGQLIMLPHLEWHLERPNL